MRNTKTQFASVIFTGNLRMQMNEIYVINLDQINPIKLTNTGDLLILQKLF